MSITLHQGSILEAETDFIVNTANSFLNHGGGLAKVIDTAALEDGSYMTACARDDGARRARIARYIKDHDHAPLIPTGGCHVTSAGALPYKGVIHAVGPIWGGGAFMETDLLEILHDNIFQGMKQNGGSVAVPAISTGIFGVPVEVVARVAVDVAKWYDDLEIQFWLFSDEHMAAFQAVL